MESLSAPLSPLLTSLAFSCNPLSLQWRITKPCTFFCPVTVLCLVWGSCIELLGRLIEPAQTEDFLFALSLTILRFHRVVTDLLNDVETLQILTEMTVPVTVRSRPREEHEGGYMWKSTAEPKDPDIDPHDPCVLLVIL